MSADNRTVSTDALETLGMVHFRQEHRDAIHLAVEPVVAGHYLNPGDHVGIVQAVIDDSLIPKTVASTDITKKVGIVDPFLPQGVHAGDRFWLVVYPRQISSLRHVWEHPDFPVSQ